MKNSIHTANIEYKVFASNRLFRTDALFDRFHSGQILICTPQGDKTDLIASVYTSFEDPQAVIKDVLAIPLPKPIYDYECFCCIKASVPADKLKRIQDVISGLYVNDPVRCHYTTTVFDKIGQNDTRYNVVASIPQGLEHWYCETYGVLHHVKVPSRLNLSVDAFLDPPVENLRTAITDWLSRVPYPVFRRAIESEVIGQPEVMLVTYYVYHYFECISKGLPADKQRIILAGPSGCGKTETYRALKKYFAREIPGLVVDLIDTNQITNEGFNGKNTNFLVSGLKRARSTGVGIVFMDEFDKRITPIHSASGDNVNREIQSQLLLAIEGCMLDGIDTSKTFFIGMGSFNEIRENRRREKHFGFDVERSETTADHFEPITKEDIIRLGGTYELVGRFSEVINYGPLSYDSINALIDLRVKEVSLDIQTKISVSDSMRAFLHANSNTEFGNRLISSFIQETVTRARIEALTDGFGIKEIILTGRNQYQIIRTGPAL